MVKFEIRSRIKNSTPTPTPSVLRNLIPPKNFRFLATPELPIPCAQPEQSFTFFKTNLAQLVMYLSKAAPFMQQVILQT